MDQFNFFHYISSIPSILSVFFYVTIIPSILCVLIIILTSFLANKEHRLLSQQLTETTITLEVTRKKLDGLQEKYSKIKEFRNNLHEAELTTKLQKPRLDAQILDSGNSIPEKYRYIQSLAQKGMSAEEIASVLAISTHEAHQLVNLSKLAQGNFTDNVAG